MRHPCAPFLPCKFQGLFSRAQQFFCRGANLHLVVARTRCQIVASPATEMLRQSWPKQSVRTCGACACAYRFVFVASMFFFHFSVWRRVAACVFVMFLFCCVFVSLPLFFFFLIFDYLASVFLMSHLFSLFVFCSCSFVDFVFAFMFLAFCPSSPLSRFLFFFR